MKVNTSLDHIYIWGNQLEEPVCQVPVCLLLQLEPSFPS